MIFSFGQSQHERVEVDVLRYDRAPVGQYHDDNWLAVKIKVCVGGFRGDVDAAFLTGKLARFVVQLRSLYDTLAGSAEFTTLEGQLKLHLKGDGKGRVELAGEVADAPGIGNRLHFTLRFDQSQLAASIRELESVISAFPIRPV